MSWQVGEIIRVQSLKHGGIHHRLWKESIILRAGEPLILANENVTVVHHDGTESVFPGLAICHFSQQKWFNTVVLYDERYRLKGYYCNIASPYCLDLEKRTLTYVDYDLDLTVEPNYHYQWIDQTEFEENRVRYQYPPTVLKEIKQAKQQLQSAILQQEEPFTPTFAEEWYHQYLSLKNEVK